MNQVTLIIGTAVIAASFAAGWYINGTRWSAEYTQLERDHAKAVTKSIERARLVEKGWAAAVEQVRKNAAEQQESISADRATTDRDVDGVREATDKRTNSAARDTPAECRSTSATSALILYSELLDRGAERIAALAEEADRRRVAGLACEAEHGVLRGDAGVKEKAAP